MARCTAWSSPWQSYVRSDRYDSTYVVNLQETGLPPADFEVPTRLTLAQNDPNPFSERTKITYSLPAQSEVKLIIYDLSGRAVRTLADARQEPGQKVVRWDRKDENGTPVAGGVYFYKLIPGDRVLTKKMAYLKWIPHPGGASASLEGLKGGAGFAAPPDSLRDRVPPRLRVRASTC
jgi:hypothetical protein